jgi:hypothetical protein
VCATTIRAAELKAETSPGALTASGNRRSDFHDPDTTAGVMQFTHDSQVRSECRSTLVVKTFGTQNYEEICTSCCWDRRAGCQFRFGWSGYRNRGSSPTRPPPYLVSRRILGPGLGE